MVTARSRCGWELWYSTERNLLRRLRRKSHARSGHRCRRRSAYRDARASRLAEQFEWPWMNQFRARLARSLMRAFRPVGRPRRASGSLSLAERVAVNFSAQLAAQLILAVGGLISVAVTTRYLDLRHYGALITALVFVSLFTIVTDFGITTIGGREIAKAPQDRRRILSSIGLVVAAISLLAFAAAIGVAHIAYAGPGGRDVRLAILILVPQLPIIGPRS